MVEGTWTCLGSNVAVRKSSQTFSVSGHTAYIFGGEVKPRQPVDSDMHVVKLESDDTDGYISRGVTSHPAPEPRVGAASTTLDGKIYVFSGRGGPDMTPIEESGCIWAFDPRDDSWSQLPPKDASLPFPCGRSYHALTSDGRATIFLHAGCPTTGRLNDLWAYDVLAKKWTELTAAPGPARGGTSIAYSDGKLYRMNGFDGQKEQGGTLDVFDPAQNSWTTIDFSADGSTGPEPRSVSCLLALDISGRPSLVTVFGERDPSSQGHQDAGKMLRDVWVFDIQSQAWQKVGVSGDETPLARGWFGADVVSQSCIAVHGGLAESNDRLDDLWLLKF